MTLAERARTIRTPEDLAAFIAALKADLDHNRADWTNGELASFLEAMAAWIQDMEGYYQSTGEELSELSPWRILADVLMAARVYE